MSDLYKKASLVMLPQLVEASKVYSIKPEDRSGDFTFSRSTAATRVNADGNIEKETQNLLTYSNTFTNGVWAGTGNYSLTSGQSGYDGSSDAWEFDKVVAGNNYVTRTSLTNVGVVTASVYAKAGTADGIMLYTENGYARWNLSTGTLINQGGSNIANNIEDVGNGWYRCSVTASSATQYFLKVVNGSGLDTTGSIYIQDAQLEQGMVARDVITTTTTAVEGGITDNVPRLDYTDASCPSLLLEPQRTNLVDYSEYFDSSQWSEYEFGGASLTKTFGYESPEGNDNAYKFDVVVGTGGVLLTDNITINPANAQTLSIWMKGENGGEKVMLALRNAGSAGASGDIITLTSEWARYDVTLTTASADRGFQFRMLSSNGVVDQTIYVYGAQLEEGSYATSYIPTYGSAVTRNAEGCEVTSAADLIGQTEGTIAGEFTFKSAEQTNRLFSISGADWNTIGHIRFDMINLRPQTKIRSTGADIAVIAGTQDIAIGSLVKFAVVYTSTTLKMFVNGAQIGSTETLSGSLPSLMNEIVVDALGGGFVSNTQNNQLNPYKQALIFKTALTDQEAIDLTTI